MSSPTRIAISLALLAACSAPAPAERGPGQTVPPVVESAAAAGFAEIQPSIYDLPVQLRDAAGRSIGIDVQRGHPVLISMFYASCPVACPVLIDELKRVAAELPEAAQAELRIVLVSFDAARDTPAVLRELAEARGLDSRWTLAVAGDVDARTLSAVLGVKYRKLESGEFFHGSTIVALDREGRPIARTDALGKRASLVSALR